MIRWFKAWMRRRRRDRARAVLAQAMADALRGPKSTWPPKREELR